MLLVVLVPLGVALVLVLQRGTSSSEDRARFHASVRAAIVAGSIEGQVSDIADVLVGLSGRPLVKAVDRVAVRPDPRDVPAPAAHPP